MANFWDSIQGVEHVVCESTLISAVNGDGHLYSIKLNSDKENGALISRGPWVEAQVFEEKQYASGDVPLLILNPVVPYNTDRKYYTDEKWGYNAAGEIVRAYELHNGDVFTISAIGIAALATEPVVGNYLTIESNGLYTETASEPSDGIVLQIIEKVNYTNSVSYRILVANTGV